MEFRRGDIYYVRPAGAVTGNEIMSGRPGIIISNDTNNRFAGTVEIVYLTTKPKKAAPTHVSILTAPMPSTALCEQINTVSVERIGCQAGRLTDEELASVNLAVLRSLGLIAIHEAPEKSDKTDKVDTKEDYCKKSVEILSSKLDDANKKFDKLKLMYDKLMDAYLSSGGEA